MKQKLIKALNKSGVSPVVLGAPGCGQAVLWPHGARVLALYAPGHEDDNFLYANPGLFRTESAREFIQSKAWVNTGGDRTWVSPETGTMICDLKNPWKTYTFPLEIDPGKYKATLTDDGVKLSGRGRIPLFRTGKHAEVALDKSFRMIANPLKDHPRVRAFMRGVAYAGYEQEVRLRILKSTDKRAKIDIWNLLVLPAAGWMIVPTMERAQVRDYMAPTGPNRLRVSDCSVRFRIDGQEQHKISLQASALTGRAGYLREGGNNGWSLVVRNFAVNPSGHYVDGPWDNPDEPGYCFQSYNDDGKTGPFGELEYHAPAIGGDTGRMECADTSQVWAFRGNKDGIRGIGELLLGVKI